MKLWRACVTLLGLGFVGCVEVQDVGVSDAATSTDATSVTSDAKVSQDGSSPGLDSPSAVDAVEEALRATETGADGMDVPALIDTPPEPMDARSMDADVSECGAGDCSSMGLPVSCAAFDASVCAPGTEISCQTSCDSVGTQLCQPDCTFDSCHPPHEVCNGIDDDCDGIIDNGLPDCWRTLYRFQSNHVPPWSLEARCLSTTNREPPAPCAGYYYEREAFIVHAVSVPGTFEAHQCSLGTDHVLVDGASSERSVYEAMGYDCSVILGYPDRVGAFPPSAQFPWLTCPLYQLHYSTPDGPGHLFVQNNLDSPVTFTCEPPVRAEVQSNQSCLITTPAGC